jgi:hypothetical protein
VPLNSWVEVEVGVDPVGCDGPTVDDVPHPPRMPMRVRSNTGMSKKRKSERCRMGFVTIVETPLVQNNYSFTGQIVRTGFPHPLV